MRRSLPDIQNGLQALAIGRTLSAAVTQARVIHCFKALFAAALVIFLPLSGKAVADSIAFNGAEVAPNIAIIHIEENAVRVNLEIFPDDLSVFEDLLPDSWMPEGTLPRDIETERWVRFAQSGLSVASGTQILPLRVMRVEPGYRTDRASPLAGQTNPLTGRKIPAPPIDPRVVLIEVIYDFKGKRPGTLTIRPPMKDGSQKAAIGMLLFDRGVPVTDFRFMQTKAEIDIDWDDPWFTRFENPSFGRTQRDGIATFLYVEPREVRHETLIRVRDIAPMLGIKMKSGEVLSPEQQAEITSATTTLFRQQNPVSIDGIASAAESASAEILELGERGFSLVEDGQAALADASFVGVILSFPVDQHPQSVNVAWDLFVPTLEQIPATIYDAAGPFRSGATVEDPEISWTNHLLTYQEPKVSEVVAIEGSALNLPVLSSLAILLATGAAVFGSRSSGGRRWAGFVVAIVGFLAAVTTKDFATVQFSNPFAGPPDEVVAQAVIANLLSGVSATYLLPGSEQRVEALKTVVTPRSLNDVAIELDRGFAVKVPGGGIAKYDAIDNLSVDDVAALDPDNGFQTIATWSANARAGHWGHDHRKRVDFRALIDVVEDDGLWKIDGLTVLEARSPDA